MKERLYKLLPHKLQNLLIAVYNKMAYKIRYGGDYKFYREEKKKNRSLTRAELIALQKERYQSFIHFAMKHSAYYAKTLKNIEGVADIDNIASLPIVDKEILRTHIDIIVVKSEEKFDLQKTGGTTGKSLEVKFFARNTQERFAFLDDFRARFGYKLGKKTAWFSGKSILTEKDVRKYRFWKTDVLHKVRYYSTFHIKNDYLKYYVEDLIKYQPEYFVGFPSTILDIAKYGIANNYQYPKGATKAIFPTAETITSEMRTVIEGFFKTKMYDQYASSEGAPFIFECVQGNLHLELQSGVFEVLDENNMPTQSGRLVVTSFTTEGTPLIRYDIGDSITLDDPDNICSCGNNNPMVLEILGRIDDYVFSPENGKINLGNISNTLKSTQGIMNFQVVQDALNQLDIYLVTDGSEYNQKIENIFLSNWRDRVGHSMVLNLHHVEEIPVEKSGKYRIVKNNIKHLLHV